MPKKILYIAISLDGYIAGKDGDLFWLSPYQDVDYEYEAFFSKIGAIIEGRRTYEVEIKNGWENVHPVPCSSCQKMIRLENPRDRMSYLHTTRLKKCSNRQKRKREEKTYG